MSHHTIIDPLGAPATKPKDQRVSVLAVMASRYSMEPDAFEATLRATVAKPSRDGREISRAEFAACLVVANEYNLNPLLKEIYFFADTKRGGVVPVVGVDGWSRIINSHPAFDGMEFSTEWDERGRPVAVECRMYRKDRSRPVTVVEYLSECIRDTDPWKKSPARMLRHKAMIQAARYAFGFSGIYDEDDADFLVNGEAPRDVTPKRRPPRPPRPPQAEIAAPVVEVQPEPPHDAETGEVEESAGEQVVWEDPPAEEAQPEPDPLLDEGRAAAMEGRLRFWLAKRTHAEMETLAPHVEALREVDKKARGAA